MQHYATINQFAYMWFGVTPLAMHHLLDDHCTCRGIVSNQGTIITCQSFPSTPINALIRLIFTAGARRATVVIMSRSLSVCVCVCITLCVLSLHLLSKRPSSFCLIHFSGAPRGQLGGSSGVKANLRWKTTFDGRRL